MSTLPFGIYMATLPYTGRQQPDPTLGQEFSLLYDADTENAVPGFHSPGDWNIYSPLTYRQVTSEADIAGASSGPSLAAPLPPGKGLVPAKPPH